MFKVNNKFTRKTSIDLAPSPLLQTLHTFHNLPSFCIVDLEHAIVCWGSCIPFVKICERYIEKQPCEIVLGSSCSANSKKAV